MSDRDEVPEVTLSLDARSLKSWIDVDEGDVILHLVGDDEHVIIEPGAGGSMDDAVDAVRRLADIAQQYLGLLERRRPLDWWTAPEVVDRSDLVQPPMNAAGYWPDRPHQHQR